MGKISACLLKTQYRNETGDTIKIATLINPKMDFPFKQRQFDVTVLSSSHIQLSSGSLYLRGSADSAIPHKIASIETGQTDIDAAISKYERSLNKLAKEADHEYDIHIVDAVLDIERADKTLAFYLFEFDGVLLLCNAHLPQPLRNNSSWTYKNIILQSADNQNPSIITDGEKLKIFMCNNSCKKLVWTSTSMTNYDMIVESIKDYAKVSKSNLVLVKIPQTVALTGPSSLNPFIIKRILKVDL